MSKIPYVPGPDAKNGAAAVWRDGYKAAMTRIETCLLAGDVESICRHVNAALAETRGRSKGKIST